MLFGLSQVIIHSNTKTSLQTLQSLFLVFPLSNPQCWNLLLKINGEKFLFRTGVQISIFKNYKPKSPSMSFLSKKFLHNLQRAFQSQVNKTPSWNCKKGWIWLSIHRDHFSGQQLAKGYFLAHHFCSAGRCWGFSEVSAAFNIFCSANELSHHSPPMAWRLWV